MTICFPETSALIALFDDNDTFHKRIVDIIRNEKIKDIYIAPSVMVEWQQRSDREHRALVRKLVTHIDRTGKLKGSKEYKISATEINVLISRAETDLKGNDTDLKMDKLMLAKRNLIDELERFFRTDGNLVEVSIKEVKRHVITLKIGWVERGLGTVLFFLKHGKNGIEITQDIISKVVAMISMNATGLRDKDEIIFSEFLRVGYAASENLLLLSGDKDFVKKGSKYIKKLQDLPVSLEIQYLGNPPK
ncbi:MAG: hypothetical protein AAE986_00005 [Thermoplasmataceae archaeon]